MEPQSSFDWRSLVWVLLTYLDHGIQTLLSHQHPVKTQEGLLKSFAKVLSRLELRLIPELALEVLLAEFGTLESSMPIKYRKEGNAFRKVWIGDVCILLYKSCQMIDESTYHIESPTLHGRTSISVPWLSLCALNLSATGILLGLRSIQVD